MKAFPTYYYHQEQGGMDLRDYFAAKAMQGQISNSDIVKSHIDIANEECVIPAQILAKQSYEIADAMMKAREQNGNN